MPDVVMPRLSDSMEEGTILKWLKAEGDEVARGEGIVEIETDKATLTYEADASGVLSIVAQEGETLPIGAVIARLGGDGGPPAEAVSGNGQAAAPAAPAAAPVPVPVPASTAAPRPAAPGGERPKASPVARRIARERGIDLSTLTGTGPGGRIVKADVERPAPAAAPSAPPAAAPAPAAAPVARTEPGTAKGAVTVQELTRTQQTIARRMAESKATIPEFTLSATIDMHEAVALRAQLKALLAGGERPVPSYNDMIVKACALALRESPRANGSYKDGRFELYSRVNVGVAVAAQDALVVPTVFDADQKTLGQIAIETRALAERVRSGQVTPPELSGGTFTVSNLGMYGIDDFTAVINPPQAAILAVGKLAQQPVVRDGQVVARHQMHVTLACDHRILYGADAAVFLARVRELLEQPAALSL
ncbi:MAG TPA: dihydrolipoamide acetyltransferase family protein [Solirubrobacteraceae bacterium]|nr:dihydrolipoamide acetyltransferase family protein [Solirubrobacteraceae bacterium]